MKLKTIYIISLLIIIYLFIIISFNINKDIKQVEIIESKRTDFSREGINFTLIQISITNTYIDPHNFTVDFYSDNAYVDSDTVNLIQGTEYSNSRLFRTDDIMSVRFEVTLDNITEPIDRITFDFHGQ